jgi:hypothetical protein
VQSRFFYQFWDIDYPGLMFVEFEQRIHVCDRECEFGIPGHSTGIDRRFDSTFCGRNGDVVKLLVMTVEEYTVEIAGSRNEGLTFSGENITLTLAVHRYADWAGNKEDRKSISVFITTIKGAAISWSSKKQSSVATSSHPALNLRKRLLRGGTAKKSLVLVRTLPSHSLL